MRDLNRGGLEWCSSSSVFEFGGVFVVDFNDEVMYHIGLTAAQGAEYAIVTGDPGRVEEIARLLDDAELVAQNREYTTWAGILSGARVLVISHGIGGPSSAICIEELCRCGVHTVIRVGTCGGMAKQVGAGDLVIANAAIRQEGTSTEYLPVAFPAVSDFAVTTALAAAAATVGRNFYIGVVHCKDSFYGQHSPQSSPVSYELTERWKAWIAGGCLASEMESAAIYTICAARGMRAGCVLHVVWNQERGDDEQVHETFAAAKTAVRAVELLIGQEYSKST